MVVCVELHEVPRVVCDGVKGDVGREGVLMLGRELLLHLAARLEVLLALGDHLEELLLG